MQNGEVGFWVAADQPGFKIAPVIEGDFDLVGEFDHVIIGQNIAAGTDNDARAQRALHPLRRAEARPAATRAADRTNPLVADRYDPLSPPALRALAEIQKKCADTGTPVSVCGELAGRPLEAFALITLGYTRLSAPAGGVGPVKRMILSADLPAARRGMNILLGSSAGSVRGEIEALARKLNVIV